MLEVSGGTINLLDATGKVVKTLVTASAGQTIVNAQLLEDHRTLWYATKTADNLACPAIMKLDLQTNVRTIEGQADDFSITPDGAELLLVWPASATAIQNNCRPLPYPSGTSIYAGAFVMRNLATGITNTLPVDAYPSAGTGGPTGHVLIVQAANVLIDSICDANSCTTHSYSVPMHRAGLITEGGIGPACDCPTLVAGPDGYYGANIQPRLGRRRPLRRGLPRRIGHGPRADERRRARRPSRRRRRASTSSESCSVPRRPTSTASTPPAPRASITSRPSDRQRR